MNTPDEYGEYEQVNGAVVNRLNRELQQCQAENEKLRHHLSQAMRFIECTYGPSATKGIVQCGNDKSTAFHVDKARAALK